jgi:hypothetical protein
MIAVPDFNELDAAFGAKLAAYPAMTDIPAEFRDRHNNPFCEVASQIFFNGGSLATHGLEFKPGIDRIKAMTALRAWLCSFEPSHELKIATVGYALSHWCEKASEAKAKHAPGGGKAKKKKKKGRQS